MKKALFFVLILLQTTAKSQTKIPANIDIHKNVMTIANFNPDTIGLVNSISRGSGDIEDLVEVMDNTGAYDLGSGFVYEYAGEKYVITCEHVIFKSGKIVGYDANYKSYELKLVGGDTFYDVAVLKFKKRADAARWRGVRFDFTPQRNTEVYAAGYWKWDGRVSIGTGNLLSEDIDLTDKKLPIVKIGFVKSDAPTNSGYSGGVLYNTEGQVIGMNNSIHTREKESYALQSKIIKRIIHDILNRKTDKVQRAFLGIQFSQNMSGGAVVIDKVLENSPVAAKYGKQLEGKSLTSIDGQTVKNIYDVLKIMENTLAGKTVTLELDSSYEAPLTTKLLNDAFHEAIIVHAIRKHEGDECTDIQEKDGTITIKTNKGRIEEVRTAGLSDDDRIYRINSLAQLGTLVRIFSLHGSLRIGTDDDFGKGRWIWFSENDDTRVLYY